MTEESTIRAAIRLRELRIGKGWSVNKLADRAGIAKQTIYNIEHGGAEPKVGMLIRLADALGVSLDDLVGMEKVA